jgi:hypothetical protein
VPVELPSTRTDVWRFGDVVVRATGPWSATVHTVLRHLERAGFDGAPRVVDGGFDDDGRERLSFIEGELTHPPAWSDDGLAELGRLLRRFHDAMATYVAPADAVWQPWYLRSGATDARVGHGDLGPWNIVGRGGVPVGFIDWELAGPIDHLDEVAQVAWLNVDLRADGGSRRLRRFVDGYRLDASSRAGLVDRMIELAARDASQESERFGGLKIAKAPTRDPVEAAEWRSNEAAWLADHRDDLVG